MRELDVLFKGMWSKKTDRQFLKARYDRAGLPVPGNTDKPASLDPDDFPALLGLYSPKPYEIGLPDTSTILSILGEQGCMKGPAVWICPQRIERFCENIRRTLDPQTDPAPPRDFSDQMLKAVITHEVAHHFFPSNQNRALAEAFAQFVAHSTMPKLAPWLFYGAALFEPSVYISYFFPVVLNAINKPAGIEDLLKCALQGTPFGYVPIRNTFLATSPHCSLDPLVLPPNFRVKFSEFFTNKFLNKSDPFGAVKAHPDGYIKLLGATDPFEAYQTENPRIFIRREGL